MFRRRWEAESYEVLGLPPVLLVIHSLGGGFMIDMTLVTIHGFWSSPATWERLNTIWRADEQLGDLQIHPFGYPSPKKPRLPLSVTRVPDYDDVAQTLATEYMVGLSGAAEVAIVTQ